MLRRCALIFALVFALACSNRSAPTVAGPESPALLAQVGGEVLLDEPIGGIVAVKLPGGSRRVLVPSSKHGPALFSLAGPDAMGRIAYALSDIRADRFWFRILEPGSESSDLLFEGQGDPMFEGALGASVALSPAGGSLAVLRGCKDVVFGKPEAVVSDCTLEIWSLETRKVVFRTGGALDKGLSFSPDGRQLAYVGLRAIGEELPGVGNGGDARDSFGTWPEVPMVVLHDMASGKEDALAVGWRPVISAGGSEVLVDGFASEHVRVSISEGSSSRVSWPGEAGGALALLGDLVIYRGLPTTGASIGWTTNNSPLVGKKPLMTVKVARLNSREFATLIPNVDPRQRISFGVREN